MSNFYYEFLEITLWLAILCFIFISTSKLKYIIIYTKTFIKKNFKAMPDVSTNFYLILGPNNYD